MLRRSDVAVREARVVVTGTNEAIKIEFAHHKNAIRLADEGQKTGCWPPSEIIKTMTMVIRLAQSLFEQEFSHHWIVVADISFGLGDLIKDIEVIFVLLADDHQIFPGNDS